MRRILMIGGDAERTTAAQEEGGGGDQENRRKRILRVPGAEAAPEGWMRKQRRRTARKQSG